MSIIEVTAGLALFGAAWPVFVNFRLLARIKRLENARDEYKRAVEEWKERYRSAEYSIIEDTERCHAGGVDGDGMNLIRAKIWGYPILENRNAIDVVNYIEGCHERHRQDVNSFQRVALALRAVSDENSSLRKELQSRNVPDGSLVAFPNQKTA